MKLNQFFITLSGDDYKVINVLPSKLRVKFLAIGVFVFFIFLFCLISSYFTYTQLFQDYIIGIPIALFFSYMFTNIYLLFLYTLNKNSFPEYVDISDKSKFKKVVNYTRKNSSKLISLSFRLIFISFIAIVISKPIELLIFAIPVSDKVNDYKIDLVQKNKSKIDSLTLSKITNYQLEIQKIKNLGNLADTTFYSNLIVQTYNERLEEHKAIDEVVNKSNFYVQGIVILMRDYPQSWFITMFSVFIFLFPGIIKNLMDEQNEYYAKKIKMDRELVENDYFKFKHSYNLFMYKKYGQEYLWKEHFEDAPFNTKRKTDKRYFERETDLLTDIYGSSHHVYEEWDDEAY